MLYNLRSDIIYYKSGSDFELEFNLCGCCRMRLLTDKPSNKKAFVHSLARAVSRSRVILIAGPIFGEENTIEIVSQALGTTTEIVDNEAYNIVSDDEIEIIKGSIPLVAGDGSFGGCIIESGPQTMILLTDNKTLRKSIMSTLIHPYVTDLYTAELKSNTQANEQADTAEEDSDVNGMSVDNEGIIISKSPDNETLEAEIETEEAKAEDTEIVSDKDPLEEIPIILSSDDSVPEHDIKPEDIFIETMENSDQNYAPYKDITIDDLFPSTPELDEPTRTIDDKINEANIVFESGGEYVSGDLPEEYQQTFDNYYMGEESKDLLNEAPVSHPAPSSEFQFLDDEGIVIGERETVFENRKPVLHIATIIVTVILLLAIIVLCYCIFSASTTEGIAPTEYIQSIWQTVFG